MNNIVYPSWWNTTLTIYNQYIDPITDIASWTRTVVTDCFWKYAGQRAVVNDVELTTSTVICRIPENEKYLSKYIWQQKTAEERAEYFTLGVDDIIVAGEVDDEIDEYNRGLGIKSTDLLAKYSGLQGCMKVTVAVENIGGGRNNPHYYIEGDRG